MHVESINMELYLYLLLLQEGIWIMGDGGERNLALLRLSVTFCRILK